MSTEVAKIDRTEIANASAIIDKILRDKHYDKNARPGAGGGRRWDEFPVFHEEENSRRCHHRHPHHRLFMLLFTSGLYSKFCMLLHNRAFINQCCMTL